MSLDDCYKVDDCEEFGKNVFIFQEDCFKTLARIPDKHVDLVFADLPYNCTDCKWDKDVIDLKALWVELKRVAKSDATPFIFTCTTAFGYKLIQSNEKMFKMDLVWKKRNKTGGLQSRYRPMRNHEMVYFFYKKAPLYNRDKYHKRVKTQFAKAGQTLTKVHNSPEKQKKIDQKKGKVEVSNYEPSNPGSVIDKSEVTGDLAQTWSESNGLSGGPTWDPVNPVSVIEEEPKRKSIKNRTGTDMDNVYTKENQKEWKKENSGPFVPTNPVSVVEDMEPKKSDWGYDEKDFKTAIKILDDPTEDGAHFSPPLPASVQNLEKEKSGFGYDEDNGPGFHSISTKTFEPPNPGSVLNEDQRVEYTYDICDMDPPPPDSIYSSLKVFIGKRNHQTEKPVDLMEFILKYWSKEDDVVLDPTMGSGSMAVACQKLDRKFIGAELTDKYFNVAINRIKNKK